MKIVCLGDSVTAGYGVRPQESWVSLLRVQTGREILNRGVSGDTTSGMLARLREDAIEERPNRVLVMGGGNDLIVGGNREIVQVNLMAIVHQLFHANIFPVVAFTPASLPEHMRPDWKRFCDFGKYNEEIAALNEWGRSFCRTFSCGYIDVHDEYSRRIAAGGHEVRDFYLDGLHPTAAGHALLADIIREGLLPGM